MASPRTPARRARRLRAIVFIVAIATAGGAVLVALSLAQGSAEAPRTEPSPVQSTSPGARPNAVQPLLSRASKVDQRRADAGLPGEAPPAPLGLLAKVSLGREEERLLHNANESAIAACMRGRGFEYLATPFASEEPHPDAGGIVGRNPGDVDGARAHGYGIAEGIAAGETPVPDANKEPLDKMEPSTKRAWLEALEGLPLEPTGPATRPGIGTVQIPGGPMYQWDRGSCLAQARRGLYGDDLKHAEMIMMLNEMRTEAAESAWVDPSFRAAVERWRDCMSKRGFTHSEPQAAANELADAFQEGRLTLEALRTREIEVATADAICYTQNELEASYKAARARSEAKIEERHRGALEAVVALQGEALERARLGFRP
jgi:hypothetical protein